MAGIGEASAILAVAHIGISLSKTLIAYVGEVQSAPSRIQRIGNEVRTTSERLQDIGELVKTNAETQTLSHEGVQSAVRCSADCQNILIQLQGVLKKGGWQQRSDTQEKEEIDISLFSSLRWAFSSTKLEVPLTELTRVKSDLMLLFSSAMALRASSIAEKAKFRKDIPELSRTREWAARKAEEAKERAKYPEYDLNFSGPNLDFPQGEPEMLQDYVAFRERRVREQQEQELAERAARLLVEQEASKKKAEEERRELEEKILNKYKMDQREMKARTAQQKRDYRVELEAAGLEQEQINIVFASSQLNFGETTDRLNIPADRPMNGFKISDNDREETERTTSGDDYNQIIRKNKKRRWKLPWNRFSVSIPRRGFRRGSDKSTRVEDWSDCEAWIVDTYSFACVRFPSSDEWLAAKIDKALNNGGAWRDLARLNERLRTVLIQFLHHHKNGWSLVLIDTRNILGIRGLRSIRHDKWVRFIISPPRSVRNINEIEDDVWSEEQDQKDINTSRWRRAQQVHVPTAHDATFVLHNGHNVEGERTGSRDEDDNLAQGGSGALERRAGDVECIPPREPPGGARNPHNDGPPSPPPTFSPYNYGPPPRRSTFMDNNRYPPQNQGLGLRDTHQQLARRSFERPRPPPTFNPYNYGPPPPRSTLMDNNRYPPQNQGLGLRDTHRQLARRSFERPRPPPPNFIAPPSRDLPNESSRRTRGPPREVGAKLSSVGQDSPPHDSSSEASWVVYPDESNMERALVRRHGGSPRVESYMRKPILNDSIRVRGEDVADVVDGRTNRLSTLEMTEPQGQTGRHKVPAQHRLHRDKYETGEEEDYVPNSNPPRRAGSEAKLTDEEVILKTLRKFTTFQDVVNPRSSGDIAISSASKTSSHGRRESMVRSRRASNDTMRSSWPAAAKESHGRTRDVSPAATATVENEQKQPWEQTREQESALERRLVLYDRDTGVVSDEPTAMTRDDELIDILESNAAKPSNELAHESSAVNSASVHHDTGTDSVSGQDPNDEITSQSHRRARFQEDEGLARDPGQNPIKRSATEPISKANPSISRSATVEDFEPDGEDQWTGRGR